MFCIYCSFCMYRSLGKVGSVVTSGYITHKFELQNGFKIIMLSSLYTPKLGRGDGWRPLFCTYAAVSIILWTYEQWITPMVVVIKTCQLELLKFQKLTRIYWVFREESNAFYFWKYIMSLSEDNRCSIICIESWFPDLITNDQRYAESVPQITSCVCVCN